MLIRHRPWRGQLTWLVAFGLAFLPWLLIYGIVIGDPLYHTKSHFELEQTILGFDVVFRPLNWPFYDEVVRISAHVLPGLYYMPVKIVQSAGSLLLAAMLVGLVTLRRAGGLLGDLTVVVSFDDLVIAL